MVAVAAVGWTDGGLVDNESMTNSDTMNVIRASYRLMAPSKNWPATR
jgi:hypothetical protein